MLSGQSKQRRWVSCGHRYADLTRCEKAEIKMGWQKDSIQAVKHSLAKRKIMFCIVPQVKFCTNVV